MDRKLTRDDLVNKVFREYDNNGAYKKQIAPVVESVFDAISEIVAEGDSVHIIGFGKFFPSTKREYVGTNPGTGEKMNIPEYKTIRFKPSSVLRNKVRTSLED